MRKLLCGTSMLLGLLSVANAAERDVYQMGDYVNYHGLVEQPDIRLRFVAYDPKGVMTLMIERKENPMGSPQGAQVDLSVGQSRDVFIKRECIGGTSFLPVMCKTYTLTLTLEGKMDSQGRVLVTQEFKLSTTRTN